MYPYHLGCHLKTGRLCRIPHPKLGAGIPVGFARIIKYKIRSNPLWKPLHYNPYNTCDGPNKGELLIRYWSIPRWCEIQKQLGEPITGPTILLMLGSIAADRSFKNDKLDISRI